MVLQSSNASDQHWSVLLDKAGIIGPGGNVIELMSNATDAPAHDSNQLVAVLDTGFTWPQVPSAVESALYSGAKGAHLQTIKSFNRPAWVIDCDAEINVTFVIGGQSYPVHPLDASIKNPDGEMHALALIPSMQDPTFDMILGMAFLTNVYMLIDYGNFVDALMTATGNPYIQLLSMMDPAQAHVDFIAVHLNGTDISHLYFCI
ncbi:hypothetical protein EI94DRAFT_1872811 [Lactarius quietus]|nr:hypothetical protein EI94DRAFT_1872811 [Lactarius quietus]